MARAEDLSIDAYRRQQRKKELKKNKTARIKARDEKVAATRSVEDVKAEISQLERKRDRNNEKSGLDAQEIKKLERLQKELRIVEAESVKRKALAEQAQIERDKELLAAQKTVEGVQKLNESKYSLVERYASVYYDEQMNPFGAPAPGQPKLYYADSEGKTTTMDSRRAVVPEKWREKFNLEGGRGRGDGPELHEDKSRVARERRWDDSGDTNCMNPPIDIAPSQQYVSAPSQFTPHPPHLPPPPVPYQVHNGAPSPPPPPRQMPPPPPPPPPLNAPPPPPPPPSRLPIDKTQPPPLPQPSKAVLRAAKRSAGKTNALADIWASQEEMEYEQTVKGTSLDIEGTADQQPQPYLPRWKRNKISAKSKGHLADVNDPCCPSADGYGEYRNRDQIERQSRDVARLQKQQHEHAANLVAAAASTSSSSQQQLAQTVPATFFYNVQQPIWYYQDNTSGAIQGPFSGEQMMGWRSFFLPTTPVRFGHDSVGKFTPLSEIDFINLPHQLVPPPPPPPEEKLPAEVQDDANVDNGVDNGDEFEVESEVAQVAMPPLCAEDDATELPNLDKDLDPEVDICIPPPSDEDDSRDEYEKDNNSVEKNTYPEVDTCIPPPSDDEADEEDELDDDGGDDQEVDMCVPPPSDDDEGNEFDVPYPSVEYPYPNDEEVPYPVDVEYPVDDVYGYPADGKEIGDAAGETSAVAPYPSDVVFGVTCDGEGRAKDQILVPAVAADRKKEYDGDKAVVGFVPSHLRVKRKVAKPSKPKSKSLEPETNYSQDETQGRSSVAGDYIKFMEEITQLK